MHCQLLTEQIQGDIYQREFFYSSNTCDFIEEKNLFVIDSTINRRFIERKIFISLNSYCNFHFRLDHAHKQTN